jgi:hypothetical protein
LEIEWKRRGGKGDANQVEMEVFIKGEEGLGTVLEREDELVEQ